MLAFEKCACFRDCCKCESEDSKQKPGESGSLQWSEAQLNEDMAAEGRDVEIPVSPVRTCSVGILPYFCCNEAYSLRVNMLHWTHRDPS